MASGFSFPPPPPPPPKPSTSTDDYPSAGRGGYGGNGRGRGRGGMRGGQGSGAGSGHTDSYSSGTYQLDGSLDSSPKQPHGQKRKLDDRATGSWRGNHPPSRSSRPHPMKHSTSKPRSAIPPAVPSFGAPLFPTNPSPSEPLPAPFAASPSPSSSEDEEAAFATTAGPLRFEHEGEIITLSTPAEIEAFQSARRRNFPTAARAAAKAQARAARAEERARIEAETALAMGYAPRQSARADALRAKLVEQKRAQEKPAAAAPLGLAGYASSDEEDEDAPPEVHSAKNVQAAIPASQAVLARPQQPCRFFAQRGRCRDGARCGFAHVGGPAKEGRGGRKTLFERLVEQERGAENRRAVLAVKFLGDRGMWKPKE